MSSDAARGYTEENDPNPRRRPIIYLDITPATLKELKKKTCDPDYVIEKQLSSPGKHSTIKEACKNSDCKYIAKILALNPNEDPLECLTQAENIENEFAISFLMSEEKLGPKVHDICISDGLAMIIMDRFDGTLSDLLANEGESIAPNILDDILSQTRHIVKKMHELKIFHRDIQSDNFLYKKRPDGSYHIVLSDFGLSVMTNSVDARNMDIIGLDLLEKVITRIKKGEHFTDPQTIKDLTFSYLLTNYDFKRNGVKCNDWA